MATGDDVALSSELAGAVPVLHERRLVPDDCRALFAAGSTARGWQHTRSDIDVYVICASPWSGPTTGFDTVSLRPDTIPASVTYVEGRRWELRYWTDDQVGQALGKASWEIFHRLDSTGERLSESETTFLGRLPYAEALIGAGWLTRRRAELDRSALGAMLTMRKLAEVDSHVEDLQGLVESGDLRAAVVASQAAFSAAVDALTISHGDYGMERKWQPRRVLALNSPIMPADQYWDVLTMQSYDPADPEEWIGRILDTCRRVALEINV